MQRLDEDDSTVRVTRSLRKRLNSVDRDSDTSPVGTSKKVSLNKTNTLEAISELGYNDSNVEQNKNETNNTVNNTPLKHNKNDKSLSEDDNSTPMVRRRAKISISEEKDTPKKMNISKTSVNNLNSPMPAKRVTRRNSATENLDTSLNTLPARRVTRRTSITSDDVFLTMTPPVKQTRSKRLSVLHIEAPLKEEEGEIIENEKSPKNNSKIISPKEKSPNKSAENDNTENHDFVKSGSPFVSLVDVLKKPDNNKSSPKIKREKDSFNENDKHEIPMVSISSTCLEENSIINDSIKISNEKVIKETEEKIKTPLRSTLLQKQTLFLSSTPNDTTTKANKNSNSFKKTDALSDSEFISTDNSKKEINIEPSKSWLQSVKGFASTNDGGIDTIVINKNKTLEEHVVPIVKTPKKKNKSRNFVESDDSRSNVDDDENEETPRDSESEFVNNEAKEVIDYSENDSMDSVEKQFIIDNEIPEDGHSIGSEDTTGDEQSDESNLSFVVNDDENYEDSLLEGSGDDLSLDDSKEKNKMKKFSKISLSSSDDENNGNDTKNVKKEKSFAKKFYLNDNVESISSEDVEIISNGRKLRNRKSIILSDDNIESVDETKANDTNDKAIYLNNTETSPTKEKQQNDTIKFIDESEEELEQEVKEKINSSVISEKSPLQLRVDKVNNEEESEDEIEPSQINDKTKSFDITKHLHNSKFTSPNKDINKMAERDVEDDEKETTINKSKSFKEDTNTSKGTPKVNKSINRRASIKQYFQEENISGDKSEEENLSVNDVFKNNKNESRISAAAASPSPSLNKSLASPSPSIKNKSLASPSPSITDKSLANKSKSNKTLDSESISQILNNSEQNCLNKSLNKSSQNASIRENNLSPLKSINKNKSSGLIESNEENEENSADINENDLSPNKSKKNNEKSVNTDDDNEEVSNDSDADSVEHEKKNEKIDNEEESEEENQINKSPSLNNSKNNLNVTPKNRRRMSLREISQEDNNSSDESEEENLKDDSMNVESSSDETDTAGDVEENNKSIKNISMSKSKSPVKKVKETVEKEDSSSALSISTILQKCEKFLQEKETNKKVLRQQMKSKKADKKQRKRKMKKEEAEINPTVVEKEIETNNALSSSSSSSSSQKVQSLIKQTKNKPVQVDVGNKKRKHEKLVTSPPNKKLSNEILSDVVTSTVGNHKQNIAGKSMTGDTKITKKEKTNVKKLAEKQTSRTDNYLPLNFLEALEKETEQVKKRKLSDKTKDDLEIRKKPKNSYFINEKDLVQKENCVQANKKTTADILLFNEEPLTPEVAKRNCGFKVSPITPVRKDFKVESIKKLKKRNLGKIIEPRTILPSTSWTRSGEFKITEIKTKKEKKLNDSEYTDFIVTSLDTKKLNKNKKLQMVIDHANNAALKFKQEKLAKHKKATCTTKQMLQSEIKGMVNKKFR